MNCTTTRFETDFGALVKTNANNIAVIDSRTEEQFTYAELDNRICQMERFLCSCGFTKNKRLFSLLPNSLETLLVFLAVAKMGGTLIPQSILSAAPEVRSVLAATNPDFALLAESVSEEIKNEFNRQNISVVNLPSPHEFISSSPKSTKQQKKLPNESAMLFLQTSGSTGEPKTMVLEVDRLWEAALAWVDFHKELNHDCRFLNYLPHAYLGGLFNLCLIPIAARGSFVITETFSGTSLLSFWNDVERFDINAIWLVPSILRGLLTLNNRTNGKREPAYKRIKFAFVGTALIDRRTKEEAEEAFNFNLLENFALSETTFLTSETCEEKFLGDRGVGSVLPYVDMRLKPIDERSEHGVGEIQVRTPFLFSGYLEKDGSVKQELDDDNFWSTGDIGKFAPDGRTLIIEGRKRDIIKKGGYMISLNEIETVVRQFDNVVDVAAIGIPHDFYGEDIAVFVTGMSSAKEFDENDIRVWISQNLAKYKWPSTVKIIDELPRTESGKIQKFKLNQLV